MAQALGYLLLSWKRYQTPSSGYQNLCLKLSRNPVDFSRILTYPRTGPKTNDFDEAMDAILKSMELLEKLLPILQSLPLWARYVVSLWIITGVIIWTSVFVYRLVSPQNKSDEVSSQQSGSRTVQQQTIESSPASTNIQGRDIIIQSTPHPIEATTTREKLGRLNIPYSEHGFIDSAQHGDTTAVKLFVEAGMNVDSKLEL